MEVKFAGGVGEHGRSCFLVKGDTTSFLVDCGLMADAEEPYPDLTEAEIQNLDYVFLTHSHNDHTGALPWLENHGFKGNVIATAETLRQLNVVPRRSLNLKDFQRSAGFTVRWGRSGHCVGSVWYHILLEGRSLLFSGDYTEEGVAYVTDPIRDIRADLAVLDSAYGPEKRTGDEMRQELLTCAEAFCDAGLPLLLPVPKYGRGLELLSVLHQRWPELPVYGDMHFQVQVQTAKEDTFWVAPTLRENLSTMDIQPLRMVPQNVGICFLSGPQLNTSETEKLANCFAELGGVILTGTVEKHTGSWRLRQAGKAAFCRIPVHCADRERKILERHNECKIVVPYHTPAWLCREKTIILN